MRAGHWAFQGLLYIYRVLRRRSRLAVIFILGRRHFFVLVLVLVLLHLPYQTLSDPSPVSYSVFPLDTRSSVITFLSVLREANLQLQTGLALSGNLIFTISEQFG